MPSRLLGVAGLAGAVALVLAGCGKGANAVSGLSPAQAVQAANTKFTAQSFKFDLDGKLTIDASKLKGDPATLGQLNALGSGVTLTGSGEEENPQRLQMVLGLKPVVDKPVTVVAYDGTAYAALDGTHFTDAGSLKSVTGGIGITPTDISTYLSNPGNNIQDKGSEQMDSLQTEHYQVPLDQSFLQKALGQATQGQSQNPFASVIEQLVQFTGGSIDVWVNQADGSLDRSKVVFTLSFDLDKLSQLFGGLSQGSGGNSSSATPSGSVGIGLNLDFHPHDYGTAVTITRPTVDPSAPKLPGGLNLFGQGA